MIRRDATFGCYGLLVMVCLALGAPAYGAEQAALGIGVRPVSPQYAEFIGLGKPYGAQVLTPFAGGSLQAGDLIVMINDTRINTPADLPQALRTQQPGDQVQIQLMRGRERLTISHRLVRSGATGGATVRPVRGVPGLGAIPTVASSRFEQEVLRAEQPVLAYFYADWCVHCKTYLPIIQQVKEQHPNLKVVGIDVDASKEIVARYGISGILPAAILFSNGQEVDKVMRPSSRQVLEALVAKLESADDAPEVYASIGREAGISDISFIPGTSQLAVRTWGQTVFVWNHRQGALVNIYRALVSALAPNGAYTALSNLKQTAVTVINTVSQQQKSIVTDQFIEKLAVSPRGTAIACLGINRDGRYVVTVWSHDSRLLKMIDVDRASNPLTVQFAFSPDGSRLVLSSLNKLELFNTENWMLETVVQAAGGAQVLQFTADSRALVAIGGRSELIELQGKRLPWKSGRSVTGNPQERLFVEDNGDNSFRLYQSRTDMPGPRFVGHRAPVTVGTVASGVAWLASGSSDGTVRLWDRSSGREIGQFAGFYNGEWIFMTPEGYYNSSPRGHEQLHIRRGSKVYGIDQFYDVFYRPDIVAAKLNGDDISGLGGVTVAEAIKSPPPQVAFVEPPKKAGDRPVKICYRVQNSGGGIGEVRLFQNGKLIKSDGFYREALLPDGGQVRLAERGSSAIAQDMRSLTLREKQPSGATVLTQKGDLVEECLELEPVSGDNEIGIAAFNRQNSVQSRLALAHFRSERPALEPRLFILAVGIDRYRDASINLKYAAKDARDFAAQLSAKATSLFKPANIHLTSLLNEQATKPQITAAVDALAAQMRHGDSFVLFVASHGLLLQNQYYIVTSGFDGSLSSSNGLISSNEIVDISKRIKALSQLFIFDTCHAGGVDTIVSGLYDARMSVLAKKMGLHIYASAGGLQTALDGYRGNGLYTHSLLRGLNNGREVDRDQTGAVTIKSLGSYSRQLTSELSAQLGHAQTPLIINFGHDSALFRVQ